MARVLESIGKELLKKSGIPVPEFRTAKNEKEALAAAEELGYPVVVKALVAVGKKGKAGAIKFANNGEEVQSQAKEILSMTVRNFPVDALLIEKKLDIVSELYLSVTYNDNTRSPLIIASSEGGIDIEEISREHPDKIISYGVNPLDGFFQYQAKEIAAALGLKEKLLQKGTQLIYRMYQFFDRYDATIVEINPLALTADGDLVAAAILMGVDDDALYRQPDLKDRVEAGGDRSWRPLTELEKEMVAVDAAESYRGTARYTEMVGGDIGFLCGGGGGSLLAFDSLLRFGGQPANYTEFGGNPTKTKVAGLVKGVLSKSGVKSFFMDANITNNTQTDVVAEGIIQAFEEKRIDVKKFPVVIRLAGVNDAKAREIFQSAGIEYYGDDITMEDAAKIIIDRMKEIYG